MKTPHALVLALALGSLVLSCSAKKPPATAGSPPPAAPAAKNSAAELMGCVNSTAKQNCFEVSESVAEGTVVRVKSRLVDRFGECPADRYCQCVVAKVAGAGAGAPATAVRCSRPYFSRPVRGTGPWVEEKYDFGAPVKSVDGVNYDIGAVTQ
jgi:hypothetical protein